MSKYLPGPGWVPFALAFALLGAAVLLTRGCDTRRDDPIGKQADTLLQDSVPVWRAERDSALRVSDSLEAVADEARDRAAAEKAKRQEHERKLRDIEAERAAAKAALDAAMAVAIPQQASASDTIVWLVRQNDRLARYAASLESENAAVRSGDGIYTRQIGAQAQEIAALRKLTRNLRAEVELGHVRNEVLASTLYDLRQATKPGIDLGLFRVPDWTDDVLLVVGTAALTYVVVK